MLLSLEIKEPLLSAENCTVEFQSQDVSFIDLMLQYIASWGGENVLEIEPFSEYILNEDGMVFTHVKLLANITSLFNFFF